MAWNVCHLTCNYRVQPLGMDDRPHFSFQLEGEGRLAAYRIVVKSEGDLVWDSGRVAEDRQVLIPYGGEPLEPETTYTWQVTAENERGEVAESAEACFGTGRMRPHWESKWITSMPLTITVGNVENPTSTAPYMRKTLHITQPVAEATLYISGVGYYDCWLDGVPVKDSVLDPAFSEYDKAVMYNAHRLTGLTVGRHVLAFVLGDGFYNSDPHDVWNFYNAPWRDHAKMTCVLNITYTDGSTERMFSDTSFKGVAGPLVYNSLRCKTEYDATRALPDNWMLPDFDDSEWPPVALTEAPGGVMIGEYDTPIRVVDEYPPAAVNKISDTDWMVDVGFNTVGWATLSMTAEKGTTVRLRYSETFGEDFEPVRWMWGCHKKVEKYNFQTDYYTAAGTGVETWAPSFKYHGFRYIHVHCDSGIPQDLSLTIQEVRSDLDVMGGFSCSDETVNRIQDITLRADRTNFHHMQTDCPSREKLGWTGDTQISAEQMLYNFDVRSSYRRWLGDVARAQRPSGQLPGIVPTSGWGYNWGSGPAWDSACTVVPMELYRYEGDLDVIAQMYPTVTRYLAFCDTMTDTGIFGFGLEDWDPPKWEHHRNCERDLTDTAITCTNMRIAARMAELLGQDEDAGLFRAKADWIRAVFRDYFIERADGELVLKNCTKSQATLATMLYHGMVDEGEKPLFLRELIALIHEQGDHADAGIMGAKYLWKVLAEAGEAELVVRMITNPTYPSFAYMLAQGATTLWEHWNGECSQNHHMFGAISAFFYQAIAGIQPDEERPAFKHTYFRPQFVSTMDHAEAWHRSPYGRVESRWARNGEAVTVTVTLPTGTTGTLELPRGWALANGETALSLPAGTHTVTAIPTGL